MSKRSLSKLVKQLKSEVPRFGLSLASASALFYLLMCTQRRIKSLKNRRGLVVFLAAMMSSLPIFLGFKKNEINLFKLFIFPLAWRSIKGIIIESKIFPIPEKHTEIFVYAFFSWVFGYCMIFEKYSSPMQRTIDQYVAVNYEEKRHHASW